MMYSVYAVVDMCTESKPKAMLEDEIVYQDLEPYFKSLDPQTRENWLREAVQNKMRLDIPKLTEHAFIRLAKFRDKGIEPD